MLLRKFGNLNKYRLKTDRSENMNLFSGTKNSIPVNCKNSGIKIERLQQSWFQKYKKTVVNLILTLNSVKNQ